MYNQFRLKNLCAHYITSSSTSSTGDIIFYCRRNEGSVLPGPTSSTFLPFVLTDEFTVMGPQWTNHTFCLKPTGNWLDTDYGATASLANYNEFDLFVYSKTSTTDSAGYVIIDYEYEFRELSLNPRAGIIKTIAGSQAQWQMVGMSFTGSKTGANAVQVTAFNSNTISGSANTAWTPTNGDIYEVVLDSTNSTYTTPNAYNTTFAQAVNGQAVNIALVDGMVLYLSYEYISATYVCQLYTNIDSAMSSSDPIQYVTTTTYSTILLGWFKLVTSVATLTNIYSQ